MDKETAKDIVDYLIKQAENENTSLYDKLASYRNTLIRMLVEKK